MRSSASPDSSGARSAHASRFEGPALAVASDQQVQWFGQTVSTAARLPSLGSADLLVTDRALAKDDAPALLSAAGFTPQRPTLTVDGTEPPILVHRYRAPHRP